MRKYSKEWILAGVFGVLFILMSVLSPTRFLSMDNLQSMAFQLPELGIISLAMMVVIVTGGINLSITSSTALSAIATAFTLIKLNEQGVPIVITVSAAILVSVAVALICGALNGAVVALVGVSPILVTLGTMTLFEGVSLNITKGGAISGLPEQFFWFGNGTILAIPVPILLFIGVVIVTQIVLEKTPWGMSVYMAGCNPKATMYSGINVKKVLFKVYLYSAGLGSIAAIIMTSRYNSAKVDYGSSYLLQSVAAAVLGGTDVAGGYGKVMGTVVAVGIIQVVSSGLNILGVSRYIVDIIMGLILIAVLTLNFFSSKGFKIKLPVFSKA